MNTTRKKARRSRRFTPHPPLPAVTPSRTRSPGCHSSSSCDTVSPATPFGTGCADGRETSDANESPGSRHGGRRMLGVGVTVVGGGNSMNISTAQSPHGQDRHRRQSRVAARLSRREVLQVAGAAGVAASLGKALAAVERASAAGAQGGELFYGLTNKFDTLDPNVTTFSDVARMAYHMFDPLLWESKAGVFVPGLAEKWEVNADATQYTFHLRRDVKFHDGTPFNAEAVKFTFDRIVDPALKSQSAFSAIGPYDSSAVADPYTVVVKFKDPYAPFLSSVAQSLLSPVSPDAVKKYGKDFGTHPVGTGPFKIGRAH